MNDLDLDIDEDIQSQEVLRLKEKVKALERQNALLKTTKPKPGDNGDTMDGAVATAGLANDDKLIEEIQLIDLDELDAGEDNWLLDISQENQDDPEDECSWLRSDVTSPNSIAALKKKSLVNKLDDIAKSRFLTNFLINVMHDLTFQLIIHKLNI